MVIANLDNDPESYDYAVTRKHLEILNAATDADGGKLVVHTLPPPLKVRSNQYTRDNPDFAPGYINFLPINGAVIAPQFGDAVADKYCKDLLARLYPGRVIEQVNIDPIAAGGGGIHCVTKHLPRA
ncbi:Agmatine deiminase [compost metagenome]